MMMTTTDKSCYCPEYKKDEFKEIPEIKERKYLHSRCHGIITGNQFDLLFGGKEKDGRKKKQTKE